MLTFTGNRKIKSQLRLIKIFFLNKLACQKKEIKINYLRSYFFIFRREKWLSIIRFVDCS